MSRFSESLRKSPGWVLLPLRIFLGFTFTFAGLQKLANPGFFNASNPASIQAQMQAYALRSPLHLVLGMASHAPVLFGLVIALGELAVGVGVLLGIFSRLAALGGMAISFLLFLSVSFHSNPFYTGSDIVFFFAWTPLVILGHGGVASVEENVKRRLGMVPAYSALAGIDFGTITRVCQQFETGRCRAQGNAPCSMASCPVLEGSLVLGSPKAVLSSAAVANYDPERRRFLVRAGTVGVAGGAAVALGIASAGVGRVLYKSPPSNNAGAAVAPSGSSTTSTTSSTVPPSTSSTTAPSTTTAAGTPNPKGTAVGPASAVPVGKVASFTDPGSGQPAYVLHPSTADFVAFSAICPHAGCTVQYSAGNLFICPCHGSQFNADTGAVLNGPATSGLRAIPVVEGSDGQLFVDG